MATSNKDYFGLNYFISLILAIIPISSLICGVLTRLKERKYVAGILRLLLGWNIIWFIDLVLMITRHKIWRLIDC